MNLANSGQALLRALGLAPLAMLAACAVLVPAPSLTEPINGQEALAAYARVLERFVDERGQVDFHALARDHGDLDRYVRHVADVPLAQMPGRNDKLAHLINSYTALSMYNVIASGIPDSHAGFSKVTFFYSRKLLVGGEPISLYDYENRVIRSFGDPRVHFALNCSAVSCPVLPRKPFTSAGLDAELERETRAFFARPENFRIEPETRNVYLSEILRFYAEDFVPGHAASLVEYANRYAPRPAPPSFEARFTPYDWSIAKRRREVR